MPDSQLAVFRLSHLCPAQPHQEWKENCYKGHLVYYGFVPPQYVCSFLRWLQNSNVCLAYCPFISSSYLLFYTPSLRAYFLFVGLGLWLFHAPSSFLKGVLGSIFQDPICFCPQIEKLWFMCGRSGRLLWAYIFLAWGPLWSRIQFCFFFLINLFYYLFLVALGGLRCGARASHCGGFSCCGARALGSWASVVVARGLSSYSSRALEHRLGSCGART